MSREGRGEAGTPVRLAAIEFEAELYGFLELMRRLRAWMEQWPRLGAARDTPLAAAAHREA